MGSSVTSALLLLLFLSVVLHESGTRNASLGPWLNNTELYFTPLLVLKITQLQDKILYTVKHIYLLYFRCNGGFPEAAWEYIKEEGLVTGGQYNSMQVSDIYLLY